MPFLMLRFKRSIFRWTTSSRLSANSSGWLIAAAAKLLHHVQPGGISVEVRLGVPLEGGDDVLLVLEIIGQLGPAFRRFAEDDVLDALDEQLFLVVEVLVERAAPDARGSDQVADRCFFVALLPKHADGGSHDLAL